MKNRKPNVLNGLRAREGERYPSMFISHYGERHIFHLHSRREDSRVCPSIALTSSDSVHLSKERERVKERDREKERERERAIYSSLGQRDIIQISLSLYSISL